MRSRLDAATVTLLLLCLAFIMYVDRSNMSVAAPVIQREIGFSNAHLGLIFSAFAIAYGCFMIPGGWLGDRIGARVALTLYGASGPWRRSPRAWPVASPPWSAPASRSAWARAPSTPPPRA